MALHLSKPKQRLLTNPSLIHLLSTFSSPPNENNSTPPVRNDANPSSISSYFSQVKASLRQRQGKPTASTAQLDQIRQNLADFQARSAVPPLSMSPPSTRTNLFQEAYERNVAQKSEQSNYNANDLGFQRRGGFDAVKESIRQISLKNGITNTEKKGDSQRLTLASFKRSLNMKMLEGDLGSKVIGGTLADLPVSVFGKEMKGGEQKISGMRTMFLKTYSPAELGEKLKMLRPQKKEGDWFSLEELNDRLFRLREMDEKEKESASRTGSKHIIELRDTLQVLQASADENKKKASTHTLNLLGHLGGTPNFMMHPPKEPLVEKYFHPDNMSSAKKMKIELAKVREEFKMSDSDCGSARVQVAQLTTKIKHLASVLHKKDKHSKKGLQAMVQRRKKLLKYLRRTDWESYCFVLERLGLRDSPDYKN